MKPKSSLRPFLALTGSAMLAITSVNATQFWDGTGSDNNWGTLENWGGDALPVWNDGVANTGATAIPINFGSLSSAAGTAYGNVVDVTKTTVNNDLSGLVIEGISFGNNGLAGRTRAFTLEGNAITLGIAGNNSITTTAIATGGVAIEDVIKLNISLGTPAGTSTVFNTNLNHNLRIEGVISSPTTAIAQFAGAAKTTLTNANNSYTGRTNISSATGGTVGNTLEIFNIGNGGVNSSIGASTNAAANLTFNTGVNSANRTTLRYVGSTNASTDRNFQLNGNVAAGTHSAIESSGTGTLSFTNTAAIGIGFAQNRSLYLGGTNTGNNSFSLALNDNGVGVSSLTKEGAGKWIINGTNTYTGATTVSAGTLLVNGSLGNTAVTVNAGAFGGTGTIGSTLNLTSGSFHVADLMDALQVTGTVSLYAGFGIDDLAGITWGSVMDGTYTLIDGTLGAGVFDALANNSLATAYDLGSGRSAYFKEGSLQLVVIPESSTALLGALGALALLRRRR